MSKTLLFCVNCTYQGQHPYIEDIENIKDCPDDSRKLHIDLACVKCILGSDSPETIKLITPSQE